MIDSDLCIQPTDVRAAEGVVIIVGPDAMRGAFTPDAAEQSALAILEAVMKARVWINPALAPPDQENAPTAD